MLRSLSFLLLLFLSVSLIAQDVTIVSGRIVDGSTGESLPYASISVNSQLDDILVGGAISGDDGRFTISGLEEGSYQVTVSFVGYGSRQIPLLIGELNRIFDLGRIALQVES